MCAQFLTHTCELTNQKSEMKMVDQCTNGSRQMQAWALEPMATLLGLGPGLRLLGECRGGAQADHEAPAAGSVHPLVSLQLATSMSTAVSSLDAKLRSTMVSFK